jgi:MraZ protein
MYIGQFQLNLEQDHSLVVPLSFRGLFAQGAYVTRGFEQNLLVMSEGDFLERYKQISALNITDPNARLLQRLLLGNASRLEIGASGLIKLPPNLMSIAGLENEVVLIGQGDHFEVWAPGEWEKQSAILQDTSANSERFAHLDLALN